GVGWGEPGGEAFAHEWAGCGALRQLLAPELRRTRDTSTPFARMILACRALNVRLWFFEQSIAPVVATTLPQEARRFVAGVLERCAGHLHALLEGVLRRQPVPAGGARLPAHPQPGAWEAAGGPGGGGGGRPCPGNPPTGFGPGGPGFRARA